MDVNFFNIGVVWSVLIEIVLLVVVLIFFSVILVTLFGELGEKIVWISKHKRGNPIARVILNIEKLPSEDSKKYEEFVVRVTNKENLDAHNVSVYYGIFGSLNAKDNKQVAGNLNGFWIKEKDSSKNDGLDGEHGSVTIPFGKSRDLFFIKTNKVNKNFSIKIFGSEVDFEAGRYILKILLYGEMARKQVIGELSGEIVFYNNGQISFENMKAIKKSRGYVSLVEESPWASLS